MPVDPGAVAAFLAARLPELEGPFTIDRLGEGQSCLTYLVSGAGWEVVLRRPPRGELPRGAFDVVREHRVLAALTDGGTGVPVPRPLALCDDPDVLGAPFYVMERVDGHTVRTTLPAPLSGHADRTLILRRGPFGHKAKSAHDMVREAKVMAALQKVYPY